MTVTGAHYSLRAGGYEAVVTELGATLRAVRWHGRPLIREFLETQLPPAWSGAVLAPWPNRIRDGSYEFGGQRYQVPINEVERGAALHGLVAWAPWQVTSRSPSAVTLSHTLWPTPGYPWRLRLIIDYQVDGERGVRLTLTALNRSEEPAPFGASVHPYLVAPGGRIDDWTLDFPAEAIVDVDSERLLPVGTESDVPPEFDFREARRIGPVRIDTAFRLPSVSGTGQATLTDDDGTGTRISWDAASRWLQICTGERPEPELDRTGLAVEPMTCPPDAFNSGNGLIELAPGDHTAVSWTISALGAADG